MHPLHPAWRLSTVRGKLFHHPGAAPNGQPAPLSEVSWRRGSESNTLAHGTRRYLLIWQTPKRYPQRYPLVKGDCLALLPLPSPRRRRLYMRMADDRTKCQTQTILRVLGVCIHRTACALWTGLRHSPPFPSSSHQSGFTCGLRPPFTPGPKGKAPSACTW